MRTFPSLKKWLVAVFLIFFALAGLVAWSLHTEISHERKIHIQQSAFYENGAFFNQEQQAERDLGIDYFREQFFGSQKREPAGLVPVEPIDADSLKRRPEPGLRAFWLGHASVLIEIDGYRVLTDPVLSQRASPFQFLGPERTHETPFALADLSGIDVVVISHNHYDHLDEATIRRLAVQGTKFFVPLGVGQHLEDWMVPRSQILEIDWWDSLQIGDLEITATPSRHYSGRSLFDYKATHWSSWVVKGTSHNIFYSGDSGYSELFKEIGHRAGPFDLSIVKIGSYGPGQAWEDIHMTPEDAVQVHIDIRAKRMLPVHWMTST